MNEDSENIYTYDSGVGKWAASDLQSINAWNARNGLQHSSG